MKKQITYKEAKEKYGIVISKVQKLDKIKFYLLPNGNVIDSDENVRYIKPVKYGDYGTKSDIFLQKRNNKVFKYLVKQLGNDEDISMLIELCEIERELTLRENQ